MRYTLSTKLEVHDTILETVMLRHTVGLRNASISHNCIALYLLKITPHFYRGQVATGVDLMFIEHLALTHLL